MGKSWFISKNAEWIANEQLSREIDQREGHYEGGEKAPKKKLGTRVRANGKTQEVEYAPNAVLGLDGDHFHMGGQYVTNMKEERVSPTEVHVYWRREDGKMYKTVHEQTSERGYTQTSKPRRIFTF